MESIYTIKLKYSKVIKLLTNGGDIILGRMVLPVAGFETDVLMKAPFGNHINLLGGILMDIQKKFWIWVLLYTIGSWCIAFHILRIVYK